MNYYTRRQLIERLQIAHDFLRELEEEHILMRDAPAGVREEFSDVMLERARVAANLVEDLDVNLPGVAVILRMRELMAEQRRSVEVFMERLLESPPTWPGDRRR